VGAAAEAFFEKAVLDVDGTLVPTTRVQGRNGYRLRRNVGIPSVDRLSLEHAGTGVHREPQREPTSHENAAARIDQAARECRQAGFRRVRVRGDTDFTQTKHLDRWNEEGMEFVFGIDAMPNLVALASQLESRAWERLKRAPTYERAGPERARPPHVKEQIVRDRGFKNLRLISEDVTDVTYRPTACRQEYRLVIVRKNLSVERGEHVLFDDVRYFFYLTNDWSCTAAQIVFDANDRCDQGEPDRPAQEWSTRAAGAGRRSREQRSVHGDGVAGVDAQSMVRDLASRDGPLCEDARRAEAPRAPHGVSQLRERLHAHPGADRATGRRLIYRVLAWSRSMDVFFRGWNRLTQRC
jgi:hypothetical protein